MTHKPEIVESIYDRPWSVRRVVRHPQYPDSFAVWNSETDEYKLDRNTENVKRYRHISSLSLAGYDASDDDAWYREIGKPSAMRRYGPLIT